jgi:hypothetical protein
MKNIFTFKTKSSLLIISFLLLFTASVFSQSQVIGSFPGMQGGFETGTPTGLASATVTTGTQLANWSYATTAQNTGTVINTTLVRSGLKSFDWTISSASATLISPTASNTAVTSATSYVVQFYWWKNNTGSARPLSPQIAPDATANLGAAVSSGNLGTNGVASTTWTKAAIVVTSGSSSANPRYGFVQMKTSGGSFANLLLDDFCVYPGSAADVTAPVAASNASATSTSNTTVDLSWTGLLKAGDGGGYVIVRSTSSTPVTLNANGIYGVGLTTATGGGTVVGIVDGVDGLNTFSDAGLVSGTTYYYSIFAADKAFNYAPAATCSVIASTSPFIITSVSTLTGFTQYAVPSPSQTYTVTGLRLTGSSVDLTVSANFQISLNNSTWASTLSLPVLSGGVTGQPLTIYVRLNAAATGSYTGTITHASSGATSVVVTLNGSNDNNTRITTSVASLSGFIQMAATPSSSQSYTVSGFAVTDASVLLTASAGYQISTDNATWSSTLNLPAAFGIITGQPKTIYVRLNDPVSGTHTGSITHTCTGATTVSVLLNGTTYTSPSLSVSPASLSFGNITLGQSSVAQSFLLNGILLSPATGTVTLTAPSGFLISTSVSSGYASSISVNYTASTITNLTIYVMFMPVNDVAYSGNINITGGTAPAANVSCTGSGTLFSIGDYGSVATGLWSAVATWKQWDGSSFAVAPTVVPTSANNVWINAGHTITIDPDTRGVYPCKNLFVYGTLIADTYTKDDKYVGVYGPLVKLFTGGFIGSSTNPTGDLSNGISIKCFNANMTITGNGSGIYLSRLTTGLLNCNVIIDHNITLTYHGTSNQGGHTVACFPEVATSSLTINAGKTLTFAPWSSLGTTESTSTLHPARTFTVNVYGSINMLNSPAPNAGSANNNLLNYRNSFVYGGTSGAGVFNLNIYNGGIVTTPEIYPNGTDGVTASPSCWLYNFGTPIGNLSNINVATGGTLTIFKVADFRNPAQTVTGGGVFNLTLTGRLRMASLDGIATTGAIGHIQTNTRNFSTTGVYCYEGVAAQNTGNALPATVSGVIINNVNNVTLTNSVVATDSINLTNGKFILGDNNATTNVIRNGSTANYVVTNGLGYLKLLSVSSTEKYFPVGTSVTSYNPAWVTNTGTSDHVSVKVEPYALGSTVAWPSGVARTFRSVRTGLWNSPSTWETESYRVGKSVNRSWTIGEDVAGGSNLSIRFQWNLADENPGFNRALSSVVRYNGSVIDYPVAPIPYSAAAGANPYTQTGAAINSTVQQFGVVSDTSTSVLFGTTTNAYPNSSISHVVINTGNVVAGNTGSNAVCGNLQIDGTLTLSATVGDNLLTAGNWGRSATGVFNPNDRTVILNGSTNTTIAATNGERFSRLYLQKSALANSVSLTDSISIIKELKVETGTLSLAAKNITLLSDSANTASLSTLNANGAIQYSGVGRFVVERYINTGVGGNKHPKSWQLLCAPAIGQTIKESWMENGAANSNPAPGYGTQIVGQGGVANGFDTTTATPSMKVYSPIDSSYVGVANTSLPINNNQGYIFFVRGDRSVIAYNAAPKPTILRSKGTIQTGNLTGPVVPANKFQSIANPYPAAVNFSTVTQSGLSPFIYMYDPSLASYYGLGAFQTIQMSNGNATPGGTSLYSFNGDYRTLQSGQAIFVRSSATAGSVTFKETDKVSDSRLMTRDGQVTVGGQSGEIISQLYVNESDKQFLVDGNKVIFEKGYADKVDINDAIKLSNPKDNFGLNRNGTQLAIETRSGNSLRDSIFYDFKPSQKGNYAIRISGSNFNGKYVYLNDNFTKKQTRVDIAESTLYYFEVNENQSSMSSNRFNLMILEKPIEAIQQLNIAENEIAVYPNPIQDKTIRFELYGNLKDASNYEIRNTVGQLIISGTILSNHTIGVYTVQMPGNAASGTYLISVFDKNGLSSTSKFIYK